MSRNFSAYEFWKVVDAMNQDGGMALTSLKVDGGMTSNNLLMQLQADLVGIDVGTYIRLHTLLIAADVLMAYTRLFCDHFIA